MKIKASELIGPALDWAVAKAIEGNDPEFFNGSVWVTSGGFFQRIRRTVFEPSTSWSQGGPIIEREITKVFKNVGGSFSAQIRHEQDHPLVAHKVLAGWTNTSGPTPLIAAMRCYVASKLSDEVEIPDELVLPSSAT